MKVNWTRKGRQRLQQLYDYIADADIVIMGADPTDHP